MIVRVDAQTRLRPSPPVRLFRTNILSDWGLSRYGVTGDGQRTVKAGYGDQEDRRSSAGKKK